MIMMIPWIMYTVNYLLKMNQGYSYLITNHNFIEFKHVEQLLVGFVSNLAHFSDLREIVCLINSSSFAVDWYLACCL